MEAPSPQPTEPAAGAPPGGGAAASPPEAAGRLGRTLRLAGGFLPAVVGIALLAATAGAVSPAGRGVGGLGKLLVVMTLLQSPFAISAFLRPTGAAPRRVSLITWSFSLGLGVLYVAAWSVVSPGKAVADAVSGAPMLVGLVLIATGALRREGDSRHCHHCDYEFAFGDAPDSQAPARCPECGRLWLATLVRGRRSGSRRSVVAGAICLVLGVVLYGPWVSAIPVAPAMPTWLLAAWAAHGPAYNAGAWRELNARTLSPAAEASLAHAVLDQRAGRLLDHDARGWVATRVAAGKLPAEIAERYFAEMFEATIKAPARVRVGEPFTVTIGVSRAHDDLVHQCSVLFDGFSIGEGPLVGERPGDVPGSLLAGGVDGNPLYRPEATLVAQRPGRTVVRARMWVIAGGFFPQVTRAPDGTPAPNPRVVWSRQITIETPIDVEP